MMEDAVDLLTLHEVTAKSGRRYFTGRLNGCKVIMLKDENAAAEWTLFIRRRPGSNKWSRASTPDVVED